MMKAKTVASVMAVLLSGVFLAPLCALPDPFALPFEESSVDIPYMVEKGWFRGPSGHRGHRGYRGKRGEPGPRGPRGYHGKRGPRGYPGLAGVDGIPGVVGNVGPQGLSGNRGADGAEGPVGNPGTFEVTNMDHPLILDDFESNLPLWWPASALGWSYGGDIVLSHFPAEINHPGIVGISSGLGGFFKLSDRNDDGVTTLSDTVVTVVVCKITTTLLQEDKVQIGFLNFDQFPNGNGVYFEARWVPGLNKFTWWSVVLRNNVVTDEHNTNVDVDTEWVNLQISCSNGSQDFSITKNHIPVTQHSAVSFPDPPAVNVGVNFPASAQTNSLAFDYFSIFWPSLNR